MPDDAVVESEYLGPDDPTPEESAQVPGEIADARTISHLDSALDRIESAIDLDFALSTSLFLSTRGATSAQFIRQVFVAAVDIRERTLIHVAIQHARTDLSGERLPEAAIGAASQADQSSRHVTISTRNETELASFIRRVVRTPFDQAWGSRRDVIMLVEVFHEPGGDLRSAIIEAASSAAPVWLHCPLLESVIPLASHFDNHVIILPTPAESQLASMLRNHPESMLERLTGTSFALIGDGLSIADRHWKVVSMDELRPVSWERPASAARRAIILTALEVEYKACRRRLTSLRKEMAHGSQYEVGELGTGDNRWSVLIAEIGAGNPGAAAEAERAIRHFNPQVALFVGVAGALRSHGVDIGDVVVASKIYEYHSGKETEGGFRPRPEVFTASYSILQTARLVVREGKWRGQRRSGVKPEAHVKPIAAGEQVLASTTGPSAEILSKYYEDALAVEMEGFGFLRATYQNAGVEALVIRGLSDKRDGKATADATGSQQLASRNAAAFAIGVLRSH